MRPRAPRVENKWGIQVSRQVGDMRKVMRPRAPRVGDKCGRQVGHKCRITRPRSPRVGDKLDTSVKSCGSEHSEWQPSVRDKWETHVKSRSPEHPEWETSVGDKWDTSVKSCGPGHPEWNASPETKAKSCGPGMQPFERSKNPIQVNLFGEKRKVDPKIAPSPQGRSCFNPRIAEVPVEPPKPVPDEINRKSIGIKKSLSRPLKIVQTCSNPTCYFTALAILNQMTFQTVSRQRVHKGDA